MAASAGVNPIIPGFSPDPSVVLVDGSFFLVNSTFHMFPGLPIYTSKDLISWKHIGNAIHRQGQLSLALSTTRLSTDSDGVQEHATGGLYAPTIRHRDGTFFVVCTNISHANDGNKMANFIVSTRDIWSNEWSDPIYFDFEGIDPSIFFDDDGKSYIQGSASPGPMTKIHLFEIDLKSGKKLTDEKKVWDGTGGIYPEGPHIYKKDSWYYLAISEGGTYEDHMITVARSQDIWGPYEPFGQNPILTARGTDEYIRHTGHSELFQDQQGDWWAVCLGVRKQSGRYVMGRETFLTSAQWADGEWPKLSQIKTNPVLPNGTALMRKEGVASLTAAPMVDYLYIRDPKLDNHCFSSDGKTITLTASKGNLVQWKDPVTFVGKRQRSLTGTASVIMHKPSGPSIGLQAGLAYYKDEFRFMVLSYDSISKEMVLEVVSKSKNISKIIRSHWDWQLDSAHLRLQYTESSYEFSYRGTDGDKWILFPAQDTIDMTAPDFVGPVIGCFASSESSGVEVRFKDLHVD